MAKQIPVKVWVGNFLSEDQAFDWADAKYDEDEESSCEFWEDIGIDWFDHDFQEVIGGEWKGYLKSMLVGELPPAFEDATENTAILLYQDDRTIDSPESGKVVRYLGELIVTM